MLTHIIQNTDSALFLIDEPDIYLHSDLQRQLLSLLKNLGPDIVIATHSTEMIAEAEPEDIVLISKRNKVAKRIKNPGQLSEVFSALGSNLNPILTQLAKTRRAVFVEGADFQILGKFAAKCGLGQVANRADFAVVAVDGFSPGRVNSLKDGMELTLGGKIGVAAIFDRDYRSSEEAKHIITECRRFCDYATIHQCKEIENFLLVPEAIERAAARKVADRARRSGIAVQYEPGIGAVLEEFAAAKKNYVVAQYLGKRNQFERSLSPKLDPASINEAALKEFEQQWRDQEGRLSLIPGKGALSAVNQHLQRRYQVSLTPTAIIEAMDEKEIPAEVRLLLLGIAEFARLEVPA